MIYVTYDQSFFGELQTDPEDQPTVSQHKWFVKDGYQNLPHTVIDNKLISISRFILQQYNIEIPKDHVIKHLDNDTLNNTKTNLKVIKYTSIYQN